MILRDKNSVLILCIVLVAVFLARVVVHNNLLMALTSSSDDVINCVLFLSSYLEEYNQMSKAPMSLVMFRFAIEHISRVSRVLRQDDGHALLVGKHTCLKSVFVILCL